MTCMVTPLTVFVMVGMKIRYVMLKMYFYKMVEHWYMAVTSFSRMVYYDVIGGDVKL